MIRLKRAFEGPFDEDGYRVLVDRLWPRGVSREDAALDRWMKELAPSGELRRWFDHDPDRWEEFRERYWRELDAKRELVEEVLRTAREGPLTLVYAAQDRERNNAVALKEYLELQRTGDAQ